MKFKLQFELNGFSLVPEEKIVVGAAESAGELTGNE